MNYRHVFHAGNFADVIKHVALVATLLHLRRKEKPFCVIDTHAGSGLYDITGSEAARSREAESGIARLGDLATRAGLPAVLRTYLECVGSEGPGCYPGSARIAARMIRQQDRLVAIENHTDEAATLAKALAPFPQARVIEGDAYQRLAALLPPRERRGAVLIDPPFETEGEFVRAAGLLALAHRRFATGVCLLWFPLKSDAAADALGGELRTRGVTPAIRLDIDIGRGGGGAKQRLSSAGLLIVNPPYTFEAEMQAAAEFLAPRLGAHGAPAAISLAPL